jgi:hypothetical protein
LCRVSRPLQQSLVILLKDLAKSRKVSRHKPL